MSSAGAAMDPHNKMRARDVNRVAKGEQAPRPLHEYGTVSPPPSPQSSSTPPPHKIPNKDIANKLEEESHVEPQERHCYKSYVEYHNCIKEQGKSAPQSDKFARHFRSLCPVEWIQRWDEARATGTFPAI
ncbi:hypothetical protein like AT1G32710 [Hibiscus trionum]|uniref:Uncharacterized protein n=1 Tax=Hibiscus trionum TaxID=183268 RepID=A0A9W7MUU3_HIBTR|nr:hypothetical protein like AT1G32710 [Hibiscus trionum]